MVRYFWSESNGTNRPTVRYMDFEPSTEYYNGMPLKKNEAGAVMPTTGEPEYICMWDYQPDGDIRTLEIPVIEIFPDTIYEKWNEDGTVEEVRFGSGGSGGGDLLETVETEVPLVITWDRNADGKEIINSTGDLYSAKVSDAVLTANDLLGSEIIVAKDDGTFETFVVAEENLQDMSAIGASMVAIVVDNYDYPFVQIVFSDFSIEGLAMSAGVWFLDNPGRYYASTFTCPNASTTVTKQQIKTELLPDALQFGEKKTTGPLNITFDGDLTGKEVSEINGFSYVRISDLTPTTEQLIDAILVLSTNGEKGNILLNEEQLIDSAVAFGSPGFIMIDSYALVVYDDSSMLGMELPLGVWFIAEDNIFVESLSNPNVTITTSEITPLPEKFIPDLTELTMISPSGKKFNVTVDDSGKLTAVEV